VEAYLPHRLDEGYGLSREAVENCLQAHPSDLLLAVDCGSTAGETIAWLKAKGIEVIVLDHHQGNASPPPAGALVNPHMTAGTGAGCELCSVGLAFKLAHALVRRGREEGWSAAVEFDVRDLLDLVALGTIADLVPLVRENRILVTHGLSRLNESVRSGVVALREVAQVTRPVGTYEVGFQLAPRLNAAGRLENASEALELLLTRESTRARVLAESLDLRNRERQSIERRIAEEVIQGLRSKFNPTEDFVIVEGRLDWHVGVVGIVASRVLQEFHRPAIILGGDGHLWRGSGRSVEGFDLAEALRACDGLLVRHGGHAMAAGVTLDPENVNALRLRLNLLARGSLRPEQLIPPLRLDAAVPLRELTAKAVGELERLQPNGQGNPPVHLLVPGVQLRDPPRAMGRDRSHVKLRVTDGRATTEVVWWGGAAQRWPEGTFDLACAPKMNEFNGRTELQLRFLDWRPASG